MDAKGHIGQSALKYLASWADRSKSAPTTALANCRILDGGRWPMRRCHVMAEAEGFGCAAVRASWAEMGCWPVVGLNGRV